MDNFLKKDGDNAGGRQACFPTGLALGR